MSKLSGIFSTKKSRLVLFATVLIYVGIVTLGAVYIARQSEAERYLQSDLVARFTFRERKGGSVENIAGVGRAVLHNPGWVKGNGYPVALRFDGRETFLEVHGINIEESFTVTGWLKSYDLEQQGALLQVSSLNENDPQLSIYSPLSQGKLGLHYSYGEGETLVLSDKSLSEGWWQHVAVVYDHEVGSGRFYINGKHAGSGKIDLGGGKYGERMFIGMEEYKLEGETKRRFFLNAAMDSISIYNRALSEKEVGLLVS